MLSLDENLDVVRISFPSLLDQIKHVRENDGQRGENGTQEKEPENRYSSEDGGEEKVEDE